MDRENAHTVVVHQQELLKQFLECKAPALHFFMDRENAHTVAVHQQELLKQFLECKAPALHFLWTGKMLIQ